MKKLDKDLLAFTLFRRAQSDACFDFHFHVLCFGLSFHNVGSSSLVFCSKKIVEAQVRSRISIVSRRKMPNTTEFRRPK